MSGDREKFLDLGMNGYVAKPIDAQQLIGEITRTLYGADPEPAPVTRSDVEPIRTSAPMPANFAVNGDFERYLEEIATAHEGVEAPRPRHLSEFSDETFAQLKNEWLGETQDAFGVSSNGAVSSRNAVPGCVSGAPCFS